MKKKVNHTSQFTICPVNIFTGPPYGRVGEWKDVDAVCYLVSSFGPSMSSVETETLLVRTILLP